MAGGCEFATTTRVKTARKKCNELLHVISFRHLSYVTRGRVYSSCFRNAMFHTIDKARSTALTAQRQSHDQTDLQCKARGCGYCQIKRAFD